MANNSIITNVNDEANTFSNILNDDERLIIECKELVASTKRDLMQVKSEFGGVQNATSKLNMKLTKFEEGILKAQQILNYFNLKQKYIEENLDKLFKLNNLNYIFFDNINKETKND